jgi:hypothetical protein
MDLTSAAWCKSSHSGTGNCVEVARNLPNVVAVRDSKNPDGGALVLTPGQWRVLVDGVRVSVIDPA